MMKALKKGGKIICSADLFYDIRHLSAIGASSRQKQDIKNYSITFSGLISFKITQNRL